MTQDEIDIMWQQAMQESIKDGEMFTRYHFAKLVAEAERERIKQANAPEIEKINAYIDHAMREVQRLGQEIEPDDIKWQQAPVKTQWGDDMVVASVAIDKDHTVDLYCERDQTPKVDVMFAQRKPLTNGEIYTAYITATNQTLRATDERLALAFARAIEAAHGIKENT